MTHPGTDVPPPPAAAAPAAPAEKAGAKKWLPIAGGVAVAGVVAAGSMTGWFGIGEPKVGDCGKATGETSFEVVGCDEEGAEFKIVGVQEGTQTYPEFQADENSCSEFPKWEVALWSGAETEEGTVYCAEAL